METIAPPARNVAQLDGSDETHAYPSASTTRASSGIAGIAPGPAASSTIAGTAGARWASEHRRLSAATLERLGVGFDAALFFPDLKRKAPALVFHYVGGWKARAVPDKSFVAGKGFALSFWNLERVLRGLKSQRVERVYVVEGELDACALVEAGIAPEAVLSVPNGAKSHAAEDPKRQRAYSFVDDALTAGLNRAKAIVWCGDQDAPGLALRSDMVRLFGAARFNFVEWPEGAKDANSVLVAEGPAALRDRVENGSLPWPVAGLYRLSEIPEPPPLTLWDPGFPEWEGKVKLAPRTLSVGTGHPGHGKTAFWAQAWFQVARHYDLVVCCASFETRPKPHMRRQLRSLFCGALEKNLTREGIATADAWIDEHYRFLAHPDQRPTLDWLLDTAEIAVIRHGAKVIQVDPWNRLETARGDRENETDYIGRCLRALHAFAHDLDVHVQILAHPAKMDSQRRGKAPGLEDISGSKHWENAVDQGFVIHRPEVFDGTNRKTEAILYYRKTRFEELGHPCKLMLDFDLQKGAYRSTDYDAGC